MKVLLGKIKKHGFRGTFQILRKLLKTASIEISYGYRLQDKLALLIRWLLIPFYIMFRGRYPYADFYPFDVILRMHDNSLFYCKRGTGDVYALLFDETPFGESFRLNLEQFFQIHEGIFLDVGANIGKYTIIMARKLGSHGIVIALEPNPDIYNRLIFNIKLNCLINVIPLNIAADSENRRMTLFVDPLYHGFSSLLYPLDSKLAETEGGKKEKLHSVEVETRRLDDIVEELKIDKEIRLVKIDVEGYEAEVLKGSSRIIERYKPMIVFEAWDEVRLKRVEELLLRFGYEIQPIALYNYIAFPKTPTHAGGI